MSSRREIRHSDVGDDAFEPRSRFPTEFEGAGVDRRAVELDDKQRSHALDGLLCGVRFARLYFLEVTDSPTFERSSNAPATSPVVRLVTTSGKTWSLPASMVKVSVKIPVSVWSRSSTTASVGHRFRIATSVRQRLVPTPGKWATAGTQ